MTDSTAPTSTPSPSAISDSLRQWCAHADAYIRPASDVPGGLIYGQGCNGWGVQTQQKALSAYGVLAVNDQHALDTCLGLLRYNIASHVSGTTTCTDNQAWGHTWISVLGIERMMHALEGIWNKLTEQDKSDLERVLCSEADWLYECYDIVAGEVENNKPESNIWNGAMLHRVAMMYPHHPKAAQFKDKGTRFLLNGISVAEDADDNTLVDGIRIGDAHKGANFFPTYSLNHHGYLNVGYMVICLSNIAMLHFSYKWAKQTPPDSLYHHAEALWQLIKGCTFDDGRLWRIGGDTRVRYCYCQDYALPMWLWAQDYLGEDCSHWIDGWMAQVYKEQDNNQDGSYLGDRASGLATVSPLYYTRLESDRACAISMVHAWQNQCTSTHLKAPTPAPAAWSDTYHGSCFVKGEKRVASFTWLGGEGPTATFAHPNDSHMVEWGANGMGRLKGLGHVPHLHRELNDHVEFNGGFLTSGIAHYKEEGYLTEQQTGPQSTSRIYMALAALPDNHTMVIMQRCYMTAYGYTTSHCGLHWSIPNDVYNGFSREYQSPSTTWTQTSPSPAAQMDCPWILVDNHWGMASLTDTPLSLNTADQRQVGIKAYSNRQHTHTAGGFIYTDVIGIAPTQHTPYAGADGNSQVYEAFVVMDSQCNTDVLDTHAQQSTHQRINAMDVVEIMGRDNKRYRITANLTAAATALPSTLAPSALRTEPCEPGASVTPNQQSLVPAAAIIETL